MAQFFFLFLVLSLKSEVSFCLSFLVSRLCQFCTSRRTQSCGVLMPPQRRFGTLGKKLVHLLPNVSQYVPTSVDLFTCLDNLLLSCNAQSFTSICSLCVRLRPLYDGPQSLKQSIFYFYITFKTKVLYTKEKQNKQVSKKFHATCIHNVYMKQLDRKGLSTGQKF